MNTVCYPYDAWLASACIPPGKLKSILELYGNSLSIYEAFQKDRAYFSSILTPRFCSLLEENSNNEFLTEMRRVMNKLSIHVIHFDDPGFPDSLKMIQDSPAMLFYQGNLNCLNYRILAMVGSRAASCAGQKATRKLAEKLSSHHISIISGLATGIDACAHQGCIDGGSPTIAVTGCGLDRIYPLDNEKLRNTILEKQGLILSEYNPGVKPAGWHFPFRNRIITGLSSALILMEAKIRSGSMTSVQHALEQGKEVFVYPGEPNSEYYEGNHQLLREGGIYFTTAEDILSDLLWLDNPSAVRQNSDCSTEKSVSSPAEAAVLRALKEGRLSFEQLIASTAMDPSSLMSTLTIMQIKGLIEALPGKHYQLKQ